MAIDKGRISEEITPALYQRLAFATMPQVSSTTEGLYGLALGMNFYAASINAIRQEWRRYHESVPVPPVLFRLGDLVWHLSNSLSLHHVELSSVSLAASAARGMHLQEDPGFEPVLHWTSELVIGAARFGAVLACTPLKGGTSSSDPNDRFRHAVSIWYAADALCRHLGSSMAEVLYMNLEVLAGKSGHGSHCYYVSGVIAPEQVPGFGPFLEEANDG